ncbi:MAG: hypothetical protein R3E56_07595 [Burkholderiaceae bacterium]
MTRRNCHCRFLHRRLNAQWSDKGFDVSSDNLAFRTADGLTCLEGH